MLPASSTHNQSKRSKQESIVAALNPDNIAKKRVVLEETKKLPQEVQDKINIRAFELIVAEALPLSIVESIHFRNYSKEIDSRVNVLCTKSLKLLIAKEFVKFKSHIRNEFQLAMHVCLTADVWGVRDVVLWVLQPIGLRCFLVEPLYECQRRSHAVGSQVI